MENFKMDLLKVWNQENYPVIFKQPKGKPLLIRIPSYQPGSHKDRIWIQEGHQHRSSWLTNYTCWSTPKSWFDSLVKRGLEKYQGVYVIQLFKEQQKCAPACWNATGFECECSCMGENHGMGQPKGRWYIVNETCAVSWGEKQYAYKLLTLPSQ